MTTKVTGRLSSRAGGRGILVYLIAVTALGIGVWAIRGCASRKPTSTLLRDDRLTGTDSMGLLRPKPDEQADNSACLDCHMDFADEMISAEHLKEGFACTACHGESVAHGEDEANVTKPDVLFGRTQIGPFCKLCHHKHESGEKYDEFVREWRGRRRPTGVMLLDDATCTDCHGRHALIGER